MKFRVIQSPFKSCRVKNVLKSQVHVFCLKWTSHEKKVQGRDIITNPFKVQSSHFSKILIENADLCLCSFISDNEQRFLPN